VVALYQRHATRPVRTFSIGFAEDAFNEADHARAVAGHLGTVHHEHIVTAEDALGVIPDLPQIYDEPFADSSQIPTYLVSRFARGQVTVALTGDGGDELFAGYNRHFRAPAMWKQVRRVPKPLRQLAGATFGKLPSSVLDAAAGLLPGRHQPHLGAKLQKGLRVAARARAFEDVYESFLDEWHGEGSPVQAARREREPFDLRVSGGGEAERMMYCDAVSYLPDDILAKVDRASMAVSLETRVPFLDHRVAEVAARVPIGMKVRGGRGKHILRQLLYRHVPPKMIDRPKAGFGVPVGDWIKGPLRPWAEELLEPRTMRQEGWFDDISVTKRWHDHLSGRRDSTPALWAVLMFQAWLRDGRR
jgi:asparagine synthase (glutamine-hydrolysing)